MGMLHALNPYFAAPFDEGTMAMLIGFGLVVVLPLTGMFLAHQRRMAELLHGRQGQVDVEMQQQMAHMQAEIDMLKMRLNDQILRVDDHDRSLQQRVQDRA